LITEELDMSSTEKYLRLHRGWNFFRHEDDSYHIANMRERREIALSGLPAEAIGRLLDALARGVPAADHTDQLEHVTGLSGATVSRIVDALRSSGVVMLESLPSARTVDRNHLYHRQIAFFDHYERPGLSGGDMNRRLQERTVVIPGLGGLGVWLALECARMGVRRIIGLDPDTVEMSNLSRQFLYGRDDIGRLKVDACRDALSGIDDQVQFEGHPIEIRSCSDLEPFLSEADFVFNVFAYHPVELDPDHVKEAIALAALHAGVPCLALTNSWLGPLTIPGETACLRCVALGLDEQLRNADHPPASNASMIDHFVKVSHVPGGHLAGRILPRIASGASLAAWEMVRFLSGIDRPPTLDGFIVLDTHDYTHHRTVNVPRDTSCRWCGDRARRGPHGEGLEEATMHLLAVD
jgi:hypothetical protein